jgi:two-component system response regulator VicR
MTSKRVLLAEDEDEMREEMRDALESGGYDVVAVADGADALAYLDRDRPSLVVLDLQMDDVSGWEVLRYLRSDPRHRDVRVLVVSGSDGAGLPRSVGYLQKPFSGHRLLEAITALPPRPSASS